MHEAMQTAQFFLLILFFALGIYAAYRAAQHVQREKQRAEEPVLHINVQITGKRIEEIPKFGGTPRIRRYAAFQTAEGVCMELRVKRADYEQLVSGQHGTLTFQGDRFIEFVSHSSDERTRPPVY